MYANLLSIPVLSQLAIPAISVNSKRNLIDATALMNLKAVVRAMLNYPIQNFTEQIVMPIMSLHEEHVQSCRKRFVKAKKKKFIKKKLGHFPTHM